MTARLSDHDLWVIDRVDTTARHCRLVRDRDGAVRALSLDPPPFGSVVPSEGLVLRVPVVPGRLEPVWADAAADVAATTRRLADATARLRRLGAHDTGGDRSL